ncbi:hypothetical protein N431DRAFT_562452 [Stipitochalara longipes BDJ]|nr:hypothetical protein N431DRAFT_562452 [Stipitochalara longipes BDJ]
MWLAARHERLQVSSTLNMVIEAEVTALATAKGSKDVTKILTVIPSEIRQLIFKELFASTTVYIGFYDPDDETNSVDDGKSSTYELRLSNEISSEDGTNSSSEMISTEESRTVNTVNTSILRTCRLISMEATPLLASHITLNIWSTKVMIDFFSTLRPEIIQSFRYLRIQEGFPIPLYAQLHRNHFTTFHVNEALCCYSPGGADPSNIGTYQAVDGLIRINGWKELHFITPTTQFISEPCDPYHERFDCYNQPVAQPSYWNSFALDRDGIDSGASVRMFVGIEPDVEGLTEDPKTRLNYEATIGHRLEIEGYENESPEEQRRLLESREVLVIAKRGTGASYIQDGSELHEDIKNILSRMTWEEILADGRYRDPEQNPALLL